MFGWKQEKFTIDIKKPNAKKDKNSTFRDNLSKVNIISMISDKFEKEGDLFYQWPFSSNPFSFCLDMITMDVIVGLKKEIKKNLADLSSKVENLTELSKSLEEKISGVRSNDYPRESDMEVQEVQEAS